jgi:hypothetical protein
MKERALKKINGRILMVRLLGNNASNAGGLSQTRPIRRLDSTREIIALTVFREPKSRPLLRPMHNCSIPYAIWR